MALNSDPFFPASIKSTGVKIQPADTTTLKTLWTAGANLNYVSPFNVTGTDVGTYQVATYMTTDVRVIFHIPEAAGLFGKTDLTVQANNVLDRNPPFLVNTNGYTAAHANPIGRLVSVSLSKQW